MGISRVLAPTPCSAAFVVPGRLSTRCKPTSCSQRVYGKIEEDTNLTDIPDPSKPDLWDSQAAGIVVQVGFATIALAAIAAMLSLAEPVIDNTLAAFPYEESGSGFYNP